MNASVTNNKQSAYKYCTNLVQQLFTGFAKIQRKLSVFNYVNVSTHYPRFNNWICLYLLVSKIITP